MTADGFTAWCACEREHPSLATELAIAITAITTGHTHQCPTDKDNQCPNMS